MDVSAHKFTRAAASPPFPRAGHRSPIPVRWSGPTMYLLGVDGPPLHLLHAKGPLPHLHAADGPPHPT
jgi:hypothetical protein